MQQEIGVARPPGHAFRPRLEHRSQSRLKIRRRAPGARHCSHRRDAHMDSVPSEPLPPATRRAGGVGGAGVGRWPCAQSCKAGFRQLPARRSRRLPCPAGLARRADRRGNPPVAVNRCRHERARRKPSASASGPDGREARRPKQARLTGSNTRRACRGTSAHGADGENSPAGAAKNDIVVSHGGEARDRGAVRSPRSLTVRASASTAPRSPRSSADRIAEAGRFPFCQPSRRRYR